MAPDIDAVTNLIRKKKIWQMAKKHVDRYSELATIDLHVDSPTSFSVHEQTDSPAPSKRKRVKH